DQFRQLHAALLDAYSTPDLKLMLKSRLGLPLDDYADVAQPRPNIFSDLIQKTEQRGWAPTLRLIDAALQSRPENLELVRFVKELGRSALSSLLKPDTFAFD